VKVRGAVAVYIDCQGHFYRPIHFVTAKRHNQTGRA